MTEIWNEGYYAIIPADVRYDPDLKPNAKLLYGELTSLCNQKGYCWATNEHFSELYGLSVGTVSRLISQLEAKGYIRCEMVATEKGSERRIYAGVFLVEHEGGLDEKSKGGLDEKSKGGLDENVKQNNKIINNKIPPKSPKGTAGSKPKQRRTPKSAPDWKPERFEGFWRMYPLKKSKQAAIRAWDSLRPDDQLLAVMGRALQRQLASPEWRRKLREEGGQGIPYPATWINGRRWEGEDRPIPSASSVIPVSSGPRTFHMEVINGEEVRVYDEPMC